MQQEGTRLGILTDLALMAWQQSPRWKLAGHIDAFSQGAVTYQTAVNYQLANDPLTVQKAYAIVNLGLRSHAKGWQVAGFINNLFDQHYRYLLNNASGSYGAVAVQGYLPRDFGRYGGVRLSYDF